MPRPRVYKAQAIVLRQRKLGEADKIVTLYTSHGGRIDAVAKGVRRTKSRLAGHLQPLVLGSYLIAEGRDLDIVTQAETVASYPTLRSELERLGRGIYCAELVDRLTPERSEGHPIFVLLRDTLARLDEREEIDTVVRYFEMRLLDELGYRPNLAACSVCGRRLEAVVNYWSPVAGGVIGSECAHSEQGGASRPVSVNALKVLRALQGWHFEDVARLRLSAELAAEIEACLGLQVQHVLEREVRSLRFLETLRRSPGRSKLASSDV
jgi:DNA repair protein RecO (recombination protein O)